MRTRNKVSVRMYDFSIYAGDTAFLLLVAIFVFYKRLCI